MAAYDHEEQEQLDNLKAWWNQHGNMLSWVLLAIALAIAGWQAWGWYQRDQAVKAAGVYSVLQQAVEERNMQRVKAASGELLEKYGSSAYASLGAMVAAKAAFESGDTKTAKAQLSWAIEQAKGEMRDLAKLRLAAVLLDEKAYDEALKLVGEPDVAAFAARFGELRGDILLAQGKRDEARAAYQAASTKVAEKPAQGEDPKQQSGYRLVLQQKIDALGGAK